MKYIVDICKLTTRNVEAKNAEEAKIKAVNQLNAPDNGEVYRVDEVVEVTQFKSLVDIS